MRPPGSTHRGNELIHAMMGCFSHLGGKGVEAVERVGVDVEARWVVSRIPSGGHEEGVVEKTVASADAEESRRKASQVGE